MFAVPNGVVDATIVGGGFEIQFRREENFVDVFFVDTAGFDMSLYGFENWEDHSAIKVNTMAGLVPFSIGSIN